MGLGKTLQVITLLQSLGDQLGHCLSVCPVSVLFNWQEELKKFSELPVHLFYGDQRQIPEHPCVILTSYALLKKDQASYFKNVEFNLLVFDEIQQIKNPHSQGAKAAKSLKAKMRIALTGTPVENHIGEYFNIMDCCVPGLWGERTIRRKESEDQGHLVQLLSRPYVLRRTKDQVLKELPPKTEQRIYLSFNEDESRRYQDALLQIRNNVLQRTQDKQVASMLKNLLELRRLCLWQQEPERLLSSKLDFLMERLGELNQEGHQSLVFSQFTSFLDLIETRIKAKGISYSRIDGSLALMKRQQQVVQFQQLQFQQVVHASNLSLSYIF
jgi:SNF2 family DNA or RNA helicase